MKISLLFLVIQLFFISNISAQIRAYYNNGKVEISWKNPENMQIDYFIIERSRNGKYFEELLEVAAVPINKSIEYYEVDYKPFRKKSYYRIKQIDINGHRYYSNVVLAKKPQDFKDVFKTLPSDRKKILNDYNEKDLLVVLIDKHKREFIAKVDIIKKGKRLVTTYSSITLPLGEYLITGASDDILQGETIVVNSVKISYTQNKKLR